MSRTGLHRPRRPRAVWDRPATGTRLLPNPHSPTVSTQPPLQALPQGRTPPPPQRSIIVPPGPRDRLWKVPGHCPACPFQRQLPDRRPSHRAQWIRPRRIQGAQISRAQAKGHHALAGLHRRPSRRTPFTRRRQSVTAPTTPPSGRAQFPLTGLHRRSPRRGHATQRRQRVHAPISPYGRALLVVETAPHRDFLASPPHPLRSSGLSQSRRRCGTSAVADHMHRCRRRRLPAQPSGTFHPRPLPFSPSFLRRQRIHPRKGRGPAPRGVPSPSPVGTTGQSPKVWAPRVGRPHPSPPTKGTAISHAHPFSIAGSPIPGRWRKIFPENNHTGTNFRLMQSKAPTGTTPSPNKGARLLAHTPNPSLHNRRWNMRLWSIRLRRTEFPR